MERNRQQEPGPIVFSPAHRGEALRKALAVSPVEVIRAVKAARLRGRGGAGFPAGMKWEFARAARGQRKFVFCNADEGEPGTFKDRVILTERPDRVFAGMTIAGYAIGAAEGVVYLRAEYAYLRAFLEHVLEERRKDGLLGRDVAGKAGFHFDIRIVMGAGAYVCGEETALINSSEGLRGHPRNRPPFPAQHGFLDCPTVVNNVETLACVTRILEDGPATFAQYGTRASTGTKLLSVSGDCLRAGVYELPFGLRLSEVLEKVGGTDAQAVQVGGPSGRHLVGLGDYHRTICFDDLVTGGAIVVFGPERNMLEVVRGYQAFFAEESCGYCTPCRVGNELLCRYLDRLLAGKGEPDDLEKMDRIARTMKVTSRCGLGQTACNPVLTSMEQFPDLYQTAVEANPHGYRRAFDLDQAVALHQRLRGEPVIEPMAGWAD
jgi:[NiFe] hydrogenase diaphorase moiety large subunit